jgi:transcriptional antiterminator RfaH
MSFTPTSGPAHPPESPVPSGQGERRWYCVQTRPKSEHIAAASLEQLEGLETYCPFLRIQRSLSRGVVWFREALFPCYVFAKFDVTENMRAVSYAQAVTRILQFGGKLAELSDEALDGIRAEMGGKLVREIRLVPLVGDETEVASGPFRGFPGKVTHVREGGERVRLLIDFLGGLHEIEAPSHALRNSRNAREFALPRTGNQ